MNNLGSYTYDVGDEQERNGKLILVACHAKIFFESIQTRITDID